MDSSTVSIYAVRNIATKQVFVVTNDDLGNQIEVINPDGKVLTVPKVIFEEKFHVGISDLQDLLSKKQVESINTLRAGKPTRKRASSTTSGTRKTKKKAASANKKIGLGAQWKASKLTFYKHKIDPLGPKQHFIVELDNESKFQITKEDFLKVFSDVTFKEKYWKEGSFSYDQVPDKAKAFFLGDSAG